MEFFPVVFGINSLLFQEITLRDSAPSHLRLQRAGGLERFV